MKKWKEKGKEGWKVHKSVGWSINTVGIIKSPCSALCSPSLVTEHRKRLTTELCIANRVCICVYVQLPIAINHIFKGFSQAWFCPLCPVPDGILLT